MSSLRYGIAMAIAGSLISTFYSASCAQVDSEAGKIRKLLDDEYERSLSKIPYNNRFMSLGWHFDFDGTEATLFGMSRIRGLFTEEATRPKFIFKFRCSRRAISFYLIPPHKTLSAGERVFSAYVGKSFFNGSADDKPGLSVIRKEGAKASEISTISDLTRQLYNDKVTVFDVSGSLGRDHYEIRSGDGGYEGKDEIARFREKCASWWEDF